MSLKKALIVDDHETVRRIVRSMLEERADWTICGEADNGLDAVEKTKALRPDLVVMDVSMPTMNGLTATGIISQELPETKVIVISQNDPSLMRKEAKLAGAADFVEKFKIAHNLVPAIENLFDGTAIPEEGPGANGKAAATLPAARVERRKTQFKGEGEMSAIMRSTDWSKTPLGPADSWSTSLRMMVNFLLANRFPQLLWWGPDFCCLYNDAYIPILGDKHPWALGRPTREVWGEIWDVLKPLVETPYHGGPATWMEDIELILQRRGFTEETHFTIAYSPAPDETVASGIGGVLATVHEITAKVLGERRIATLRELGAQAVESKTAEEACANAARVLSHHTKDVPFSLLYLFDSQGHAQLAGSSGVADEDLRLLKTVNGGEDAEIWPVAKMKETENIELVEGLNEKFRNPPLSAWLDPLTSAAIVPLRSNLAHQLAGFMIAGISPRSQFDESYRNFFELMSTQIATIIANARSYEEERKRSDALAEIDRAKTAFFSNVSHEFRTPLTLMMGPLEDVLADQEKLPTADRERLELAHRNSLRLLKLVNTILDFSRIEAGRIEASFEPTDLAKFTAELASMFRSAVERAGLRLVIDCPPIAEPVYVDREMWEKIIFNLLSNAFKFTFDGEIGVSLQTIKGAVELAIRDTGTGIPQEDLPHLFERFYRVKNAKGRTFEGSGIGLALVQELARLHGGAVRVESQPERGSTFVVTIPLGKEHLPADRLGAMRTLASTGLRGDAFVQEALRWLPGKQNISEKAASEPLFASAEFSSATAFPNEGRARVLLADDNADMREYVQQLLSEKYEVITVTDGESALQNARRHRPDMILTDVMMPRLDGFGLLQAIRADESLKYVPVILLSARAGEEARIEGLSSGADDYLIKPFSARELLARVGSQLTIASIRGQSAELERKMRLDSERLAAIVTSSDDAIISKNLDGIITTWNKGAERIFGYTAEETIGQPITIIIPPDRRGEEIDIISRLRRGERIDHFQTVRMRKDGSTLDASLTISPIRDASGRVIGASKVARDISQQSRIERALRESEERFRAIVETTPECVKLIDPNGVLLHMNSSGLQMIGAASREAVVGKSVYDLIAPEHRDKFREFNQRICSGERGTLEFDIIGLKGNRRHMETHAAPLHNPDGTVVHLGVTRDVTERKHAEETLRQHRERFDLVNQSAQVGFWFCDLPFNKLIWDDRVKEHFWLAPDAEVTIDTFYARLRPDDREPTSKAIEESIANDVPCDIEYRVIGPQGQERWIRAMGKAFYDEAGTAVRFDGITLDVTDRKLAEENYRKLTETLEAEVHMRTRELEERNVDVLRQTEQLRELSRRLMQTQDEERRHMARELHDSAGQTLTILGMNLAQLVQKAGRKSPELAADAEKTQELVQQLHREIRTTSYLLHPPLLDEAGLPSALSWYIQGLSERSNLGIQLHISEQFERLPRDLELAIFRIVQECLTNVHRHSSNKTASIRITREADIITVEVEDKGKGMSSERLLEIQSKGSGVGIRGMRERLRQFGGNLNIFSDASGTRILVMVPVPAAASEKGENPLQAIS